MRSKRFLIFLLLFSLILCALTACGSGNGKSASGGQRKTVTNFLLPSADGKKTGGTDTISVDSSNLSEGYVMVRYTGDSKKVKMQMTIPDGTVYTYSIRSGNYESFPLSGGDGSYRVDVLELAYGDNYYLSYTENLKVKLADEFRPFLYPNEYSSFDKDSKAAAYGVRLSKKSSDDLDYLSNVYEYVVSNITYDEEKAENVSAGYIPDADETLKSKKGICFDYAALMTVLLRSQNIPTKLEVGYSGSAYHAWISVYLKESGWVDNVIEFDGKNWSLADPTLAASNSSDSVKDYIGDGSNYTVKYNY